MIVPIAGVKVGHCQNPIMKPGPNGPGFLHWVGVTRVVSLRDYKEMMAICGLGDTNGRKDKHVVPHAGF
jgi:hypothetical protein